MTRFIRCFCQKRGNELRNKGVAKPEVSKTPWKESGFFWKFQVATSFEITSLFLSRLTARFLERFLQSNVAGFPAITYFSVSSH